MRPPAQLVPWLSPDELAIWVREAPDKASYQKRLAVWLTFLRHPAPEIADYLQVSIPAVWLWIKQYNHKERAGWFVGVGEVGDGPSFRWRRKSCFCSRGSNELFGGRC